MGAWSKTICRCMIGRESRLMHDYEISFYYFFLQGFVRNCAHKYTTSPLMRTYLPEILNKTVNDKNTNGNQSI